MIPYTKPFLSVDKQVSLLRTRGLAISDEIFATNCLKNMGYYRLSGYWYPMRKSHAGTEATGAHVQVVTDDFREGTKFSHVIDLYTYDKRLRLLLLDMLEQIEIAIRTDITLQLGRYSPWAYRDSQFFDKKFDLVIAPHNTKTKFACFLEDFDTKVVPRSKADFVSHFKNKYADPLPIWAAVELWDFGTLATLFEGMKVQDRREITHRYGLIRPDILPSWIRSMSYIRNVCAHHSRLWNKPPIRQPKLPKINEAMLLNHLYEDRFSAQRLYAVIAIIRYMQLIISPESTWVNKLIELNQTFPTAPGIRFRHMGYPDNWTSLDLWKQ